MATQTCPNCQRAHDVKVYVTGQKILCGCGIRFDVRRTDVTARTVNHRPSRNPLDSPLPAEPTYIPRSSAAGAAAALDLEVEDTATSAPALEVPGYELGQLLGRGGMGEVWKATQRSLGRTVAVKLLPPELARDPEFVARFEKESAALAALSHPHIIQIIDRGSASGNYYFVMEFVEGRSLREAMSGGRVTPVDAPRIVLDILRAMEAAHQKNIIHRDLKPENILLDGGGHLKVADFGLAGMRGGEERFQMTATSVAMGTLNYMAPEQRRDARSVDQRADLYAVGVILYELLTGELPIGRFKLPSERTRGVNPAFDPVVEKLLQPDPEHRYATATQVIADLQPLLSGSGVGAMLGPGAAVPVAHAPASRGVSVVQKGFRGVRNGLMVIGALVVIAVGSRLLFGGGEQSVTISGGGKAFTLSSTNGGSKTGARLPHSGNTYGEVFSEVLEEALPGGRTRLQVTFAPGPEELNVHTGEWRMGEGKLSVIQAGNDLPEGKRLIPRAFVAHRYFNADDLEAEVDLVLTDLKDRYQLETDVQRFAEVAFRIKDLQVSAFAIPGVGMRLGWRYYTEDGTEVVGNSARDLELMVEDETPTPPDGRRFKLGLVLRKHPTKDAVEATGYLDGRRFARKLLPGLQGQVGKIALGCRNYECAFDHLSVQGLEEDGPRRRVADATLGGQ
jgi:predicted Ser/Thr protein kinase